MDRLLGSLFPTYYRTPLDPVSVIELVIYSWLAQELPAPAELLPALMMLQGWRHEEVYEFMRARDWTAGMYEGQPICQHEYQMWHRLPPA